MLIKVSKLIRSVSLLLSFFSEPETPNWVKSVNSSYTFAGFSTSFA